MSSRREPGIPEDEADRLARLQITNSPNASDGDSPTSLRAVGRGPADSAGSSSVARTSRARRGLLGESWSSSMLNVRQNVQLGTTTRPEWASRKRSAMHLDVEVPAVDSSVRAMPSFDGVTPLAETSNLPALHASESPPPPSKRHCSRNRSSTGLSVWGSRDKGIPAGEQGHQGTDSQESAISDWNPDMSSGEASLLPSELTDKGRFVTPKTVSDLLDGKYSDVVDEVKIIDCRYPYEYDGGHIKGAVHMDDAREMPDYFFGPPLAERARTVIIFHCEYSQSRGPGMWKLVRKLDRLLNSKRRCYDRLCYPEMYILSGGYRAMFHNFKRWCHPQAYVSMFEDGCSPEKSAAYARVRQSREFVDKHADRICNERNPRCASAGAVNHVFSDGVLGKVGREVTESCPAVPTIASLATGTPCRSLCFRDDDGDEDADQDDDADVLLRCRFSRLWRGRARSDGDDEGIDGDGALLSPPPLQSPPGPRGARGARGMLFASPTPLPPAASMGVASVTERGPLSPPKRPVMGLHNCSSGPAQRQELWDIRSVSVSAESSDHADNDENNRRDAEEGDDQKGDSPTAP